MQLDTLKLYTKAHGAKTMNLIINMENDEEWILDNENEILASHGIGTWTKKGAIEQRVQYDSHLS